MHSSKRQASITNQLAVPLTADGMPFMPKPHYNDILQVLVEVAHHR